MITMFVDNGTYTTSGASEIIFWKPRARSSRNTGPKIRVPFGSRLSSMITQALSSLRTYVPSGRRISFATRTITAFTTAFFLMFPFGRARLIATTIISPTLA